MRIFVFFVAIFVTFSCETKAIAQTNVSGTFAENLSLGSSGTHVAALQKILNQDPDTRVANTGLGSPGNETEYFGLRTKLAVIRFQEKYAGEILAPAGFTRGNGYVGSYTRTKLNALSVSTTKSIDTSSAVILPATPPQTISPIPTLSNLPSAPSKSTSVSENPNLKNLDKFMAALDGMAAKKGLSSTTLAAMKKQIIEDVATTTDLRAAFLETVKNRSKQSIKNTSPMGEILATIEQTFEKIFMPKRAHAAVGVPFGGALLFAYYCEDSFDWLITISPLPPSYATLLSYVPFSQAYLSYNIPATNWLLGAYAPSGICVTACPYCIFIPTEGTITPVVGSSPL